MYDLLKAEVLFEDYHIKVAIKLGVDIEELNLRYTRDLLIYNFPFPKDILARAYYRIGEIDKAIGEYKRLLKLDSKTKEGFLIHPKYYFRLAKLYDEVGEKNKAINNYHRFLQIWQNADKNLVDVIDAKIRLDKLK